MKLRPMGLLTIAVMCFSSYPHSTYAMGNDRHPEESHGEANRGAHGHGDDNGDDDGNGAGSHGGNRPGSNHAGGPASGSAQAILDYCSQVDPAHRREYAQLNVLAQKTDTSKGEGGAFEKTYASVSASLQEVSPSQGKATCMQGIKRFTH